MPKLSIVCPSYNHEPYIIDFLNSFISQTEKDIELVIVDDCSTDNSINIVKEYQLKDSRIKLYAHNYNMGINKTIYDGFKYSSSKIVSLCASDDILMDNYAQTVIHTFNTNPNIHSFFTSLEIIDSNGKKTNNQFKSPYQYDKFNVLAKLFFNNFMPAPGSAFIRETVLHQINIPNGIFQLQDYHFHTQILLLYDTYFYEYPLVYYRVTKNSVSINKNNSATIRTIIEQNYINDLYLNIKSVDLLKAIFPNHHIYNEIGEPTEQTIPFFISLIAINGYDYNTAVWGYHSLINYYNQEYNQDILYNLYNFEFSDLINQANKLNALQQNNNENIKISKLRKKRNFIIILFIISFIFNIIFLLDFFI